MPLANLPFPLLFCPLRELKKCQRRHILVLREPISTNNFAKNHFSSGEKGDGQQLPELIRKTEEAGMEVDSIVADKAYSSKENLKMAKENNMHLSARLSSVIDGNRTNKLPFEYNKDADLYVCPAGHLAKWKEMNNRKK